MTVMRLRARAKPIEFLIFIDGKEVGTAEDYCEAYDLARILQKGRHVSVYHLGEYPGCEHKSFELLP